MKQVFFILTILAFALNAHSQDVLVNDFDDLKRSNPDSDLVKPDKGKIIDNGIFFTKSIYKEDISSDLLSKGGKQKLSKTFEINIEKGGNYFFAANILPANNVDKLSQSLDDKETKIDILEVRVFVNTKFIGTLKQSKLDWELVPLHESNSINLQAGNNVIRFESDAPYYPMIDAVRITELERFLIVENKAYNDFVSQLRQNSSRTLSPNKESQEEIDAQVELKEDANLVQTRSAMNPHSYDWQVTPVTLSCPSCTYQHRMNVPIVYTYYRKLSLAKGNYTFMTGPISGNDFYSVDPVMYLYKIDDPHTHSYSNDDYSGMGYHSRIDVSNIPAGEYYLVIRAFNVYYASTQLGRQGLVNVFQNGALLNSSVPVSGYLQDVSSSNTGLLNYFTTYSTGIPIFWLQENHTNINSRKLKFFGSTFFYVNPMDYYWFNDARMRLDKSSSATYSMLVSAEGAMGFYFGNCDVYGSAKSGSNSGDFGGAFPNLKSGDCIISAPASNAYNCASWAGGRTDLGRYFWASGAPNSYDNFSSNWYVPGNYWQSWDNFFGNNPMRSATATTYSRTPNGLAEVSLWTGNHAAIRLAGNLHPHGYDWESKAGGYARLFHPESAFNQSSYGSVLQYYYPVSYLSTYSTIPFEQELSLGLTVLQDVQLSEAEKEYVNRANRLNNSFSKELYKKLLSNYINIINSKDFLHVSDPETLCNVREYKDLESHCKIDKDDLFYQLIEDSFSEDALIAEIVSSIFTNLTYNSYKYLLEEVKSKWEKNCYTKDGAYIAPSPIANKKNYIKMILSKQQFPDDLEKDNAELDDMIDNNEVFIVAPNPVTSSSVIKFTLSTDANIVISLTNIQNGSHSIILNSSYKKGIYEIPLNISTLTSGVYVCSLIVGKSKLNRKILIQ